jgi:flagellar basal-body rod protein FlgG
MAYSLLQALNVSRQDMMNRLADLDVVSSNLANENTVGFKTNRSNFKELLSIITRDGGTIQSSQIMDKQGAFRSTGNTLDWAVEGDGFFQVKLPDGTTGYTRDGQFQLDANGTLVNSAGYSLIFTGTMPKGVKTLSVGSDGTLTAVLVAGGSQNVGTVSLARFANTTGLLAYGSNIFLPSQNSGQPQTGAPGSANFGTIRSTVVEQSNVNVGEQMTEMITLQRSFQMSVRAFQQTDTMISEAIHMRKA